MTGTRNQSHNFNLKPEANLFLKSLTTQQSEKITTICDTNITTFGKYLPANTIYICCTRFKSHCYVFWT